MIAVLIAAISFVEAAILYLFKYKFACLDGDRCAVVHIESIVHNEDSDQSLNTILAPLSDVTTTEADYMAYWQAKTLLYSDSTPPVSSRGWNFKPASNGEQPMFGNNKLPLFHCEIEGAANYEGLVALRAYMIALIIILAGIIVLAAIGAALGPFYYLILVLVAFLILFALLFAGKTALSESSDAGDATSNTDVGDAVPGPGGFVIADSGGRTIKVGDFAVLYGQHVIDTGHHKDSDGTWCEIHPIKAIARIDKATYDLVSKTDPTGTYDQLCKAMGVYVQRPISDSNAIAQAAPVEHDRIG